MSASPGIFPSAVYGYADAIRVGTITCSPPHTDSKPSASARRQISSAESESGPALLANDKPNFMPMLLLAPLYAPRHLNLEGSEVSGIFDLGGRVAVVTGGNGGIGLGVARGLAKAGADLAIWARNQTKSEAAQKELERISCSRGLFGF